MGQKNQNNQKTKTEGSTILIADRRELCFTWEDRLGLLALNEISSVTFVSHRKILSLGYRQEIQNERR